MTRHDYARLVQYVNTTKRPVVVVSVRPFLAVVK